MKTQVGHANVKFRGGSGIVQLKTRLTEECSNSSLLELGAMLRKLHRRAVGTGR